MLSSPGHGDMDNSRMLNGFLGVRKLKPSAHYHWSIFFFCWRIGCVMLYMKGFIRTQQLFHYLLAGRFTTLEFIWSHTGKYPAAWGVFVYVGLNLFTLLENTILLQTIILFLLYSSIWSNFVEPVISECWELCNPMHYLILGSQINSPTL